MTVEQLRAYNDAHLDELSTFKKMGKAVGMSPFYFKRLFKSETGMTPREYLDASRLSALKQELHAGRQVTAALYEAGYSSSSRLCQRGASLLGMTPGSYKKRGADELIQFAFIRSKLGLLILGATERGLAFLQFGESEEELKEALQSEFPAATIVQNADALAIWIGGVTRYLSGKMPNIELPVDMRGTAFQQAVWLYLRRIPAGETRTYAQVAEAIGHPKAVRAVASACASNQVAMAIPCHRVIRRDGSLGGYRWGLDRKEALLAKEKAEK